MPAGEPITCEQCQTVFPRKSHKGPKPTLCLDCRAARHKEQIKGWDPDNAKRRAGYKKWKEEHPEKHREKQRKKYARRARERLEARKDSICETCGTTFTPQKAGKLYCSVECWPSKLEAAERARDARLKKDYGISQEIYEEMLARQNGVCAICGKTNGSQPLYIDHHHESGMVRELLCNSCNRAIGLLKEDPELFRSVAGYLDFWNPLTEDYLQGLKDAGQVQETEGQVKRIEDD